VDDAKSDTTVLLGKDEAEPALLGQLGPEIVGHSRRLFHPLPHDGGGALVLEELPRASAKHLLLLAEAEIHGRSLLTFRQAEDALADDVLLDLGGATLDRVGARAEERVLPDAALDRPVRPARELRVGTFDLHGQLLELLVSLHPDHLSDGGFRPRDLALEQSGDRASAQVLQALGVDPE